jgi:hypothetical protein
LDQRVPPVAGDPQRVEQLHHVRHDRAAGHGLRAADLEAVHADLLAELVG